MLHLKRILFPTDFYRCSDQALDHALYLAKNYQAELLMLHAIVLHEEDPHNPVHHFPNIEEVHKRLKYLAVEKMSAAVTPHKESGIAITMEQRRGFSPAEVILDYAREKDADLIVMGTHGRRGLEHLFLGSVAEEVIRLASCPVLTIREREVAMVLEAVDRVLVPVDFSVHASNALSYAKEIAAAYDAKLQLLHVVEETIYPDFYLTGKAALFELEQNLVSKAEEMMDRMLQEAPGPRVESETHTVLEGHAASEIVNFAGEQNVDLIVIATHGLSGLEHLLMGSVTEKVVRQAPCPVFTVRAFGKSLIG